MPDYGERPAEENERMLETASCRDPPPNNYAIQMLERSLPSQQQPQQQQQQQQHQSVGRKLTGGIMHPANYRGWPVEIRIPKWADSNKLWIKSEDRQAAQYIADAMRYLTGQLPFHFPDIKIDYLPLLLSTGEELTTREKCSVYVAKIAKGPALVGQRKDFKERAQKLILEMLKTPEVVQFLEKLRAWQPLPEANTEGSEDENGTAMGVDTPSEEAIETSASTVTVNFSQCGSLVPVAEDTHFVAGKDGEEENETPMEVDSLSVEAMMSYCMDVDQSTPFVLGFELNEPGNILTSANLSLGIWRPRSGEQDEGVVPDNLKELFASLDKDEAEARNSTEPSDWDPWLPPSPFDPHSPLLAPSLPRSGWQSRGTTSGADADHEALRPPVRPIL